VFRRAPACRRVGRSRHIPRIAAAVLIAAAFAGGTFVAPPAAAGKPKPAISWLTDGFDAMRTGYNGHETTIGPANAHRIHKLWSTDLHDVMVGQPVEAGDVDVGGVRRNLVYEGTEQGDFFAIRADTGRVLWQKNLGSQAAPCHDAPGGVFGIGGAAAISFTSKHGGVVYVAGGDGAIHALDLATGAEPPGWPVQGVFSPLHETVWGGLNLLNGRVYVAVASHCDDTPYYGGVTEIGVAQHSILHRFYPAGPPSAGVSGGGVWGPGGVSIDPANRNVFAATGNALTEPENHGYSDAVVELYQSLGVRSSVSPKLVGRDVDFGSTPVLFRPAGCPTNLLAAENKNGALFVYSEGAKLGSRHTQRLQVANIGRGGFKGEPAWDPVTDMLYVASTSDSSSGPYRHGLVALKAKANCSVSLAWQRTVGPTKAPALPPPTVANGVVYYGDGPGDTEFAFDAASGRQLWRSSTITGSVFASATIVNGRLLVPSWDNHLYAFGVG
jgi:outer membrane protein assembly factor BamB